MTIQKLAYAGIGSRTTPAEICEQMSIIAYALEEADFLLRSGAADGADSAFERGVQSQCNKQIFLPWPGFNAHSDVGVVWPSDEAMAAARKIAAAHHPVWDKLKPSVQHLHTRNVFQVLGPELNDPIKFVICWTENGSGKGGTGQALRIARAYSIPVLDMGIVTMQEIQDSLNAMFD